MRLRFLASICLFLLPGNTVLAQSVQISKDWNTPVQPFRIIGNIYYVGASDLTSFLITSPQGHILLDSGMPETAVQILQNVPRLGFSVTDIKILINSHTHFDHAGGLGMLRRLTGARILMNPADEPLAARGGKGDPQFGDKFVYPPFRADGRLVDGKPVRVGAAKMTPHFTPGHTKGCTSWSTEVIEGDKRYKVVFVCSLTAPGYKLIGNDRYANQVEDYRKTFHRLRSLEADVFLAAHGSFFHLLDKVKRRSEAENPFVDPAEYPAFVERSAKTFEEQLAKERVTKK